MKQRFFIGTAPEIWQKQNIQLIQQALICEAKPVPPDNLHMTVCFLGHLTSRERSALEAYLTQMTKHKFSVQFDQLHLWRKPQVLCLLAPSAPRSLQKLYEQIQEFVCAHQCERDTHPFRPHITLFRKAKTFTPMKVAPIVHSPTHLNLYHSESTPSGVKYHVVNSWPLTS